MLLKNFACKKKIKSLYNQLSKEKIQEAYEVLEKCEKSPEILKIAAKVYATLGYAARAQELMSSCDFTECEKHLIQALIHRSKEETSEFTNLMRDILEKTPEDFEVTVLLAQMFYDQGNKDKPTLHVGLFGCVVPILLVILSRFALLNSGCLGTINTLGPTLAVVAFKRRRGRFRRLFSMLFGELLLQARVLQERSVG